MRTGLAHMEGILHMVGGGDSIRASAIRICMTVLSIALLTAGCEREPRTRTPGTELAAGELTGAWRSEVRFKSGAFSAIQDLEFLYVFNAGGTLTESSNYDGAPPVPPAYGIWKRTGSRQYEARYEFTITKAPARWEEIPAGGGWLPAGRGVLVEKILLSEDATSFRSTIRYEAFGSSGLPQEGGGEAEGTGTRIAF